MAKFVNFESIFRGTHSCLISSPRLVLATLTNLPLIILNSVSPSVWALSHNCLRSRHFLCSSINSEPFSSAKLISPPSSNAGISRLSFSSLRTGKRIPQVSPGSRSKPVTCLLSPLKGRTYSFTPGHHSVNQLYALIACFDKLRRPVSQYVRIEIAFILLYSSLGINSPLFVVILILARGKQWQTSSNGLFTKHIRLGGHFR
ncbi:hypothetical protein TNCT_551841 [Trichonephila clavata]|uniref:Uncharacterized protein n=1 Tax=Trichonephila clavata TaxID=2740835 RepID=A0A8X6FV23_TRICU|nr:hypothetical protein TNCT_551841 [Trichonephila clavata]